MPTDNVTNSIVPQTKARRNRPLTKHDAGVILLPFLIVAICILGVYRAHLNAKKMHTKAVLNLTDGGRDAQCSINTRDEDIDWLPRTTLQSLSLKQCGRSITDNGLMHVKKLTRLHTLDLSDCSQITGEGLANLVNMAQLQTLNLGNCVEMTDDGLKHLARLKQLRHLDLNHCVKITDAGLAHLKELTELQSLNLASCPLITGQGMEYLKDLPQLMELDISGRGNTAYQGLASLKVLNNLKSLNLSRTGLKNEDMTHMKEMKELSNLDISGCTSIGDEGIQSLKDLHAIWRLDLSGCMFITDKGLAYLLELPKLKQLYMQDGKMIAQDRAYVFNTRQMMVFAKDKEATEKYLDQLEKNTRIESAMGGCGVTTAGWLNFNRKKPDCEVYR